MQRWFVDVLAVAGGVGLAVGIAGLDRWRYRFGGAKVDPVARTISHHGVAHKLDPNVEVDIHGHSVIVMGGPWTLTLGDYLRPKRSARRFGWLLRELTEA